MIDSTQVFKNHDFKTFTWSTLHKKVVQIVVSEPTDSDINEGNFMAQVMAMDDKLNLYVIDEWDIRKEVK